MYDLDNLNYVYRWTEKVNPASISPKNLLVTVTVVIKVLYMHIKT